MLEVLWRHIVASLSSILVVGLSGEWDRTTVEFIFKAAQARVVPIYDVRLSPGHGEAHYIYDVWRRKYPDVEYYPLYGTGDAFASATGAALKPMREKTPVGRKERILEFPRDVERDFIWKEETEQRGGIVEAVCNHPEVTQLKFYSQLGLKTFWWGAVKQFSDHNRYYHSLGAMMVAERWYEHLEGWLKRMGMNPTSLEQEKAFLATAMLLHDYGHLPFSHLFEEIFDELHWMPAENPRRPWHELLTKKKVQALLESRLPTGPGTVGEYLAAEGHDLNRLVALIDGCTGKAYLDGIVNSPVDADKIDYIFRDLWHLKFRSSLPPDPRGWLAEFLADQDLSPDGLIRLNGGSALRMLEFIETRRRLYQEFYLSPELRSMERITSHILVSYLAHYVPTKLERRIRNSEPFAGDHGEIKAELASQRVLDVYRELVQPGSGKPGLREGPLIEKLLDELINDGQGIDAGVIERLKHFKKILARFQKDEEATPLGRIVREVYREVHVAGPYYANEEEGELLREIVREIVLMYQGRVLFDVVRTPKLLAGANSREFAPIRGNRGEIVGETFLVPDVNPAKWTVKSRARVPMNAVDFGPTKHRHFQVLIVDPAGAGAEARYVHQQFLRKCVSAGISLQEKPGLPGGYAHG